MAPAGQAARPVTPVGIAAAELAAVERELAGVDGVADDVRDRLRRASAIVGGLDEYVARCTSPESAELRALAERTAAHDWDAGAPDDGGRASSGAPDDGATRVADGPAPALEQEMLSGHVEGRALAFLVHATRARRVLEVGMFTGYSALAMAEALPPDGVLVACEVDPGVAELARDWMDPSPASARVRIEVGPAADTLARLAGDGEAFDLVFVDADKAGYAGYVDAVLDGGLLAADGLIAVDNTLMQGEPWTAEEPSRNGAAIAAFNARLAEDPRVEQVLLPLRDGLTLIRRV